MIHHCDVIHSLATVKMASKSDGYQVFCDHYSSLVKGIKANLDKVGPKLEKAELLTPEAQDVWKNGSHNQNKKTFAILNAIEEKLKEDLDYFWRLVSVLRSLPTLAHLASKLESSSWQSSKGATHSASKGDTHSASMEEQCTEESESTNVFLPPTQQGDPQHQIGEIVLPNLPVQSGNKLQETAMKFPSVAGPSFGAAASPSEPGNFTKPQLEVADTSSGENVEQQAPLRSVQQRHRIRSEEIDEESMRLKSLERAVRKVVSGYVLGEKAKLEADYEEKCERIRAECKQELEAMSEYYQNVEEELKLADSAHAAEIKYLKRTHEEEQKDLISTRQLQAKMKDTELEQKERELKALQENQKKKLEDIERMEAQLKAMKNEVKEMAKKVRAKEEGVSELRKWRSLQLQKRKEEVKNKRAACKEIGELISQWFEGNRDEAIKKQIEGKIQDIKSKRRGSKTM